MDRCTKPITFEKQMILKVLKAFLISDSSPLTSSFSAYATVRHEQADVGSKYYQSEE